MTRHARVACSGAIHAATAHADGVQLADGRVLAETQVVWLPPFEVGTIIALGINYADHACPGPTTCNRCATASRSTVPCVPASTR